MRGAYLDKMMRPVHRWVWADLDRRVRKLLMFAEVETDGGRDILRAAEVTPDPLLRRLYPGHAIDEVRHRDLFRERGGALLHTRPPGNGLFNGTPPSRCHRLGQLPIDRRTRPRLLALLV